MFRAMISPIFRSTRLCVTAGGIMHPRCCRPATSWVYYTTSCKTQSSAPEYGWIHRPKHVELIGTINKSLLLHLIGCPHYLYLNNVLLGEWIVQGGLTAWLVRSSDLNSLDFYVRRHLKSTFCVTEVSDVQD